MTGIAIASAAVLALGLVVGFELDTRLREWWRRR